MDNIFLFHRVLIKNFQQIVVHLSNNYWKVTPVYANSSFIEWFFLNLMVIQIF